MVYLAATSIVRILAEEPLLVRTGALALAEALGVALFALAFGARVGAEGDLWKAVEAYSALGLFSLTVAGILPHARLPVGQRRAWASIVAACVLFSSVFEVACHAAGVDPRISVDLTARAAVPTWLYGFRWVYWATSQAYLTLLLVLTRQFFLHQGPSAAMNYALRYALLSGVLGGAVGWCMLLNWQLFDRGRQVGSAGDLVVVHAFAFHGLHVMPLAAWACSRRPGAALRVNFVGVAWLSAAALLLAHTLTGRSIRDPGYALQVGALALASCLLVPLLDLLRPTRDGRGHPRARGPRAVGRISAAVR